MAYLKCEACEAKALAAASQCPRCAHAFDLRDARGERVALKVCRSCGILHRRDRACHWCPASAAKPAIDGQALGRRAAAIAALVLVGVAGWQGARALQHAPASIAAAETAPAPLNVSASSRIASEPTADQAASTVPMPVESLTAVAAASDSVRWVPAVALTWVNVRREAARNGDVVGVIKPAAKAYIGHAQGRAGWVLVKSPDVSGWVDPRLFSADSTRTRG